MNSNKQVCSGQEDRKEAIQFKKKKKDPKRNYSSPANLKYKPRGLATANNNVYQTVREKIFAVFFTI